MAAKVKLSITLDADVARTIDCAVSEKRWPTRSAAIEAATKAWILRERALRRDAAIEAYYRGQSSAEKLADRQWAEGAWSAFVEIGEREEASRPKRTKSFRRKRKA